MKAGMHRRNFIKGTALTMGSVVVSGISGCLTSDLYSDNPSYNTYIETLNQLYITADEGKFVILGKRHHYIIDIEPALKQAIESTLRAKIQAEFQPIYIDENQELQGNLLLRIPNMDSLEEAQLSEAKAMGFSMGWPANTIRNTYEIRGVRYASSIDLTAQQATKLNATYTIQVYTRHQTSMVAKALMTPITVTVDGALMIVMLPLAPVLLLSVAPFKVK